MQALDSMQSAAVAIEDRISSDSAGFRPAHEIVWCSKPDVESSISPSLQVSAGVPLFP